MSAGGPDATFGWNRDFDWPFGPPPTRDYLLGQGLDADAMHLLGLNESPLPPGQAVQEGVARGAALLNRYPDNVDSELVAAVARRTSVGAERQVWGSGAGELINRAVGIAARERLTIVSPSPTFWGYERCFLLFGSEVTRIGHDSDGRLDVEALLGAVDRRTGIVTFATPGNPNGLSLSIEEIAHIARNVPDDVLLMVDEVYFEFAAHEGGPDALAILQRERKGPWIVLRSFSKAYRLAGARIGYGLAGDERTARRIREHSLNFTISAPAFAAALAAYEDVDGLAQYLAFNARNKALLNEALTRNAITALPSSANFVSARLNEPAKDAAARLRGAGIICAPWNHADFPHHLRIGVGDEADTSAVIDVLTA